MQYARRIRLAAPADTQRHFYALAAVETGPGSGLRSIEQLARPITAQYSRTEMVNLDRKTFESFVANFNANTLGQEIYLDRAHDPNDGVNGTFRGLSIDAQGRLLGDLEWSPLGVKTFNEDGFKYFSIDFTDDYVNRETGKSHGPLLFGAALVPRPFIKNMTPSAGPGRLMLSEGRSVFVPSHLRLEDVDMKKFLEALRAKLAALKLSDGYIGILLAQFEAQAKALLLGDDETKLGQLEAPFLEGAKQLAAGAREVKIDVNSTQLSADLINKAVADALKLADDQRKTAVQTLATNRKTFADAVNAATGLSAPTKTVLLSQAEALTADMSAEQVQRLAASAVEMGNQMEARLKLAGIGFNVGGTLPAVQIVSDIGSNVHGLMRERLMLTDHASPHHELPLRLPEQKNLKPFARKVLAEFDRLHGARLDAEAKRLAGDGSTVITDGNFPVVAQRQVIIELLADLKFLSLVQTIVDPTAQATIQIPYEVRNTAAVVNNAVVYEGQPIALGGVTQLMDQSYITPRKIAMLMSDEMLFFSRNALINWDAWARNIASNSRLLRDIIASAISREMQRSADSFGAVAVVTETLTSQCNGARNLFKTAQFPVVRPKTFRNLQGNAIGSTLCPITMTYNSVAITAYDGTNKQAAGNYFFVTDYNLGYFQIVNQLGAVQTPANATPLVINAYSYATNVTLFSIDVPAGQDYSTYLNNLLFTIGRRKAILNSQRFVPSDFGLCSSTLHNTITEAKQFEANSAKPGNDLTATGDLGMVKGIPFWGTNQPGVDLLDSRILMGQSGTCSYGIAKPFVTGSPFEAMDPATGLPIGKKYAYGEEFSTIHVPQPIWGRMTSVVVYSATARAAV